MNLSFLLIEHIVCEVRRNTISNWQAYLGSIVQLVRINVVPIIKVFVTIILVLIAARRLGILC